MKIGIIHNWSDDNKGDSAILFGTLNYIEKHFNPTEVDIFSISNLDNPDYDIQNHKNNFDFKINKAHNFFNFYPSNGNRIKKLFSLLINISRIYFFIIFNITVFLTKEEKILISQLKKCNLLISKGGYLFKGLSFLDNISLVRDAIYFFLGAKYKIKTCILSQSIGPFNTIFSKRMIKLMFRQVDQIFVRELISKDNLELNNLKNKIQYFPDMAFNVKPNIKNNNYTKYKEIFKNSIGITIREHIFKSSNKEEYLNSISFIIDNLIKKNERVLLIAHCCGPNKLEDDRIITNILYKRFKNRNLHENISIFTKNLDAPTLVALYGELKFLIGTRFHSVIFALSMNVPSFAISYSGPKAYIMKNFNLNHAIVPIEDLYYRKIEIKNTIHHMLNNINNIKISLEKEIYNTKKMFDKKIEL
jgi:colanic acid/amylovoran biosynthesis protein